MDPAYFIQPLGQYQREEIARYPHLNLDAGLCKDATQNILKIARRELTEKLKAHASMAANRDLTSVEEAGLLCYAETILEAVADECLIVGPNHENYKGAQKMPWSEDNDVAGLPWAIEVDTLTMWEDDKFLPNENLCMVELIDYMEKLQSGLHGKFQSQPARYLFNEACGRTFGRTRIFENDHGIGTRALSAIQDALKQSTDDSAWDVGNEMFIKLACMTKLEDKERCADNFGVALDLFEGLHQVARAVVLYFQFQVQDQQAINFSKL